MHIVVLNCVFSSDLTLSHPALNTTFNALLEHFLHEFSDVIVAAC
jgi:hypothetical protein